MKEQFKKRVAQRNCHENDNRMFNCRSGEPRRMIADMNGRILMSGTKSNERKSTLYKVRYGWLVQGEPKMYTVYMGALGEAYKLWQYLCNSYDGVEAFTIERVNVNGQTHAATENTQYLPVQYYYATFEDLLLGHAWYLELIKEDYRQRYEFVQIEWMGGCKEVLRKDDIK